MTKVTNGVIKILVILFICFLTFLICTVRESWSWLDYLKNPLWFFAWVFLFVYSFTMFAIPWVVQRTIYIPIILMVVYHIIGPVYYYFNKDGIPFLGFYGRKLFWYIFNPVANLVDILRKILGFSNNYLVESFIHVCMIIVYIIELIKPDLLRGSWVVNQLNKLNKFFFSNSDWSTSTGNNIGNIFPREGWIKGTIEERTITVSLIVIFVCILTYLLNQNINLPILSFIIDEDENGEGIFTLINIVILLCIYGHNFYSYLMDYGSNWTTDACNDAATKGTTWSRITTYIILLIQVYILLTISYSWSRGKIGGWDYAKLFSIVLFQFIGPIMQMFIIKNDNSGNCSRKKNEEVMNFLKITAGAYSSGIISIILLAGFLLKIFGIALGEYKLISVGIVPGINNLGRTFMLLIANLIGFLPYWLGNMDFGRL